MLFSRPAEYAIRAMTFLARQPAGKLAGARQIAQAEQIPRPFLWKILRDLTRRKLIRSFKGLRGGYELARPPQQITLAAILAATGDGDLLADCVLGLPQCGEENPCPLHDTWKPIRRWLVAMLEQNNLADLARAARRRVRRKRR